MYAGLAAFVALVWLATLSERPLFNTDEGRYAEIPREMLAGGDWVIPHLNGLAYIEKPPLQYWATALCLRVFGLGTFGARFYTALLGLATLGLVWLLARSLWGRAAAWRAAGVLAGMPLFAILGQLLTLDMGLTFFMTLSLVAFVHAQRVAGERRSTGAPPRSGAQINAEAHLKGFMLLAWAAAAAGVLSKGLVAAAIPAAVLVLYTVLTRDASPWRRLHVVTGLPLFLAITLPWHVLAARRLPDFLSFFFVHEHFARYLTPSADREEPWWFFGPVLLAGTLPWLVSVLRVLAGGWRGQMAALERRAAPNPQGPSPMSTATPQPDASSLDGTPPGFDAARFLWLWVVFVVVFFSVSDSKLIPYVLPALPALALLIAARPAAALRKELSWSLALTLVAASGLGLASLNWRHLVPPSERSEYLWLLANPLGKVAAVLGVTAAFVWSRLRSAGNGASTGGAAESGRGTVNAVSEAASGTEPTFRDTPGWVFLGAGWCLAVLCLSRAAALVAPMYSGAGLAAAVPLAERQRPVFSVATYDQTLPFYWRRTVTLVAYRGELDYGLRHAPGAEIGSIDAFLPVWSAQTQAFAVMETDMFDTLKQRGMPMHEITRDLHRVLVAR
jgi:4-amino-4-deoxy-L-arabinose transferase-like glycosyltransferase